MAKLTVTVNMPEGHTRVEMLAALLQKLEDVSPIYSGWVGGSDFYIGKYFSVSVGEVKHENR